MLNIALLKNLVLPSSTIEVGNTNTPVYYLLGRKSIIMGLL